MPWTKRMFVEKAFEEIGRANYVFDISPEMFQSACVSLDSMMAFWDTVKGIRLGYPQSLNPSNIDFDTIANVPDFANLPIYKNLACIIAPPIGKMVMPETTKQANDGLDGLISWSASNPPQVKMPSGVPAGAGWKFRRRTFLPPSSEVLDVGDDAEFDL